MFRPPGRMCVPRTNLASQSACQTVFKLRRRLINFLSRVFAQIIARWSVKEFAVRHFVFRPSLFLRILCICSCLCVPTLSRTFPFACDNRPNRIWAKLFVSEFDAFSLRLFFHRFFFGGPPGRDLHSSALLVAPLRLFVNSSLCGSWAHTMPLTN